MEVVTASPSTNGVSPYHNHDVREWSRIDNLTGALERARLETDHWSASTNNSAHNYNKVVDSRARSDADGAVQQRARRQLEVFQSSIPGGSLQVIKSHTVSSSRWSTKSTVAGENKDIAPYFEDLELSLNPLDLTSQKSKAIVGRSLGKRPPTRPHNRDEVQSTTSSYYTSSIKNTARASTNLHRISRLCNQIHESAVKQTFGTHALRQPSIYERQNDDENNYIKTERTKPVLNRTKSSSSEDINLLTTGSTKSNKSIEDLEDLEQLQNWRRASKIRRSLQFPKQSRTTTLPKLVDLPKNSGSVRKIREDLETGRRLNTALRGNNVDLEALDQILQSISNSSGSDKNSVTDDKNDASERDILANPKKQKRSSFVTVESLKEVKDRLRRTSSPKNELSIDVKTDEDIDDGIVTEENNSTDPKIPENSSPQQSRVKSYVYGMETMISKRAVLGTGSLESRSSKQIGGISANRNEDWYNRRKSYGFEQVHNQHEPVNSITKTKTVMDSSTDSGICRSSEIVVVPVTQKHINYKSNSSYEKNGSASLGTGSVKRYTSIFENKNGTGTCKVKMNEFNKDNDHFRKHNKLLTSNEFGGTVTIPITATNTVRKYHLHSLNDQSNSNEIYPLKRHSIAVDESKYVKLATEKKISRTSVLLNDIDDVEDDINQMRKSKKVEFCKTEVHFAAESGRVNIVETDDKPPPTNNFRRRRRHSATLLDSPKRVDLPLVHFGESGYEKNQAETVHSDSGREKYIDYDTFESVLPEKENSINNTVTITTGRVPNHHIDDVEEEQKELIDNETPKGILKNKPIKPKPYLLGDNNFFSDPNYENPNSGIWGVKLKSVHDKQNSPVWKSTVTLRNSLFQNKEEVDEPKPADSLQMELQKILQNLQNNSNQNNDSYNIPEKQDTIRIIHPTTEASQSSLPPYQSDYIEKLTSRGYSTKVNIGQGEAIVVKEPLANIKENNSEWTNVDNSSKDLMETATSAHGNQILSKPNNSIKCQQQRKAMPRQVNHSPISLKKIQNVKKNELKTAYNVETLYSPSLVGQKQNGEYNSQKLPCVTTLGSIKQTTAEKRPNSPSVYIRSRMTNKCSPLPTRKLSPPKLPEKGLHQNCPKSPMVLRNPKKSEMTYFGIKTLPKPGRQTTTHEYLSNKPDLIQNTPNKQSMIESKSIPIYQNIVDIKVQKKFDSSILDELTKAADQILQAVNEYAEEANMKESDTNDFSNEKLETISETKSWRRTNKINYNCHRSKSQTTAKRTSSTSSIDSISDHTKILISNRKDMPFDETRRKKNGSETSSSSKAAVKARRLQRASSREALLQSHGSSSEDLPICVPIRKPRGAKKTKTGSTTTNESDIGKVDTKKIDDKTRSERLPIGALPEIRHKTAVSTIRSTAEKSAMRDRMQRSRQEESRKMSTKKDVNKSTLTSKSEKSKSVLNKEPISHRISTANIKKCHKSEISLRQ